MLVRFLTPALLLGLLALGAWSAENTDAKRIRQLIEQLGADTFADRQQAFETLDALGQPALEALREARSNEDAEIRKRATDLVARIEKRTESARLGKPTLVHLTFKNKPLAEAITEFSTQAKVQITLHDPENKCKGSTVTLDTGKVGFWKALDQFCLAAELTEGDPNAGQLGPAGVPVPAANLRNAQGRRAPVAGPIANNWVPVQPGQIFLMPGKSGQVPTDASTSTRVRPADRRKFALPKAENEVALVLEASLEPRLRWQTIQSVRIDSAIDDNHQTLTQIPEGPTANARVVGRVVVLPAGGVLAPGIAGVGVGNPFSPSSNGIHQYHAVKFKAGEKESSKLKKLKGTITAEILDQSEKVLVVKDILKAAGKRVTAEDGYLEILAAEKGEDGSFKIRFSFSPPSSYQAETISTVPLQRVAGQLQLNALPLQFNVQPLPAIPPNAPKPVPAEAPGGKAPAPAPVPPGAAAAEKPAVAKPVEAEAKVLEEKKPVQAVPNAQPKPAPARQIVVNGGGVVIINGNVANLPLTRQVNPYGLTLEDAKGNRLSAQIQPDLQRARIAAAPIRREYIAVYKPGKDEPEPYSLVFTGRKGAIVNVPFKLENVDLK